MSASIDLKTSRIGRFVYIRCGGKPPSVRDVEAAANAWLPGHVAPCLGERMMAWERHRPIDLEVLPREKAQGLGDLGLQFAGTEEAAAYRLATHAVAVGGYSDGSRDGWLGVSAAARGIAAAFDGVVVDCRSEVILPLDDWRTALREVDLKEVCRTFSFPTGRNRWMFVTSGLENLGLPDAWFEDVRGPQVALAVSVIQELKVALAERASAHVRAGASGKLIIDELDLPSLGPVVLDWAPIPLGATPGLRARAAAAPGKPLGSVLSRPARLGRRPADRPATWA